MRYFVMRLRDLRPGGMPGRSRNWPPIRRLNATDGLSIHRSNNDASQQLPNTPITAVAAVATPKGTLDESIMKSADAAVIKSGKWVR